MGWWTPRFLFLKKWSPRLQLQASETSSALLRRRLHTRMKKLPRHSRNIPHSPAKSAPRKAHFSGLDTETAIEFASFLNNTLSIWQPALWSARRKFTYRAASNPRTTRQMRMQQTRQADSRNETNDGTAVPRSQTTSSTGEENRGRRVCSAHQRQ